VKPSLLTEIAALSNGTATRDKTLARSDDGIFIAGAVG
jgi:hypothetical protein